MSIDMAKIILDIDDYDPNMTYSKDTVFRADLWEDDEDGLDITLEEIEQYKRDHGISEQLLAQNRKEMYHEQR